MGLSRSGEQRARGCARVVLRAPLRSRRFVCAAHGLPSSDAPAAAPPSAFRSCTRLGPGGAGDGQVVSEMGPDDGDAAPDDGDDDAPVASGGGDGDAKKKKKKKKDKGKVKKDKGKKRTQGEGDGGGVAGGEVENNAKKKPRSD